jgi:hypothetical protein
LIVHGLAHAYIIDEQLFFFFWWNHAGSRELFAGGAGEWDT